MERPGIYGAEDKGNLYTWQPSSAMPFITTLALCVCALVAALVAIEVLQTVVPPGYGHASPPQQKGAQAWALFSVEYLSAKLLQSLAYVGVLGVLPPLIELPQDWFASGLPAQVIASAGLAIALLYPRTLDNPPGFWGSRAQR